MYVHDLIRKGSPICTKLGFGAREPVSLHSKSRTVRGESPPREASSISNMRIDL